MSKLSSSDRKLLLPTWAAADGLGQLTLLSLPFMLEVFIDYLGLGPADAGALLSIELCTISLACMAISAFVGRLPKRTMAIVGASLAIAGNALSMQTHSFGAMAMTRVVAGVGYGLAMAAGNAVVAAAGNPERLYDSKMMLFALTQLVVDVLVPSVSHYFGTSGCFGFMVAMNLLMLPVVLRLPQHAPMAETAAIAQPTGQQQPASGRRGSWLLAAILVALAVVFAIRESAYWGFLERFGAAASVDAALVGFLVGIGTVPSVVVPRLVTFVRARFGEIVPTLAGVLLEGVVLYLISATTHKAIFMGLLLVWPVFYCYTVPLLMGVAARLDKQGRIIAVVAGALQIAFAIGPALAGVLVEKAGLPALGPFAVGSTVLLLLLALLLPRKRATFAAATLNTR